MGEMVIRTNNHPRLLMDVSELPEKWVKEYDSPEEGTFFKYGNQYYSLAEFMTTEGTSFVSKWDGMCGMTAFSCILIRLCEDRDYVVVAYCHS